MSNLTESSIRNSNPSVVKMSCNEILDINKNDNSFEAN